MPPIGKSNRAAEPTEIVSDDESHALGRAGRSPTKPRAKGQSPTPGKGGRRSAKETTDTSSQEDDSSNDGTLASGRAKQGKRPPTKPKAKKLKGAKGKTDDPGSQSDASSGDESVLEDDPPPPPLSHSLQWGMEDLQQRVYQEGTAASVFAGAVSNARLRGIDGIDEAEAAIGAIFKP